MAKRNALPRWLPELIAAFVFSQLGLAQLPTARLDGLDPRGGQAGQAGEIVLQGVDLDDVRSLIFSHPGLTASHIDGSRFQIAVADDVPAGVHEVRASGRYGISTPALFVVGTLPEMAEAPDNQSSATAQSLPLGCTVNARAAAETSDFYRLSLRPGQTVHLDCAAQRIDSPLDAILSVRDPAGREIQRAERTFDRDPALQVVASLDGEHVIEIHDATWRGGPGFVYRLTVDTDPRTSVTLPPPQPLAGALLLRDVVPPAHEVEPNDTPATAQRLNAPADIEGSLDRDWFVFTPATTGPLVVEVYSHRLGVASDPVVVVHAMKQSGEGRERMEKVGEFDDVAAPAGTERFRLGSRDPEGRFHGEAGVTYRIWVTDRFKSGERFRLQIRPPAPDFQAIVLAESPTNDGKSIMRWTPMLRRGATTVLALAIVRQDGFNEAVTVKAARLPAGVSMAECVVPPDRAEGLIVLRATPDADVWEGPIALEAQAGDLRKPVREVTARWNVSDARNDRVDIRLAATGPVLAVRDIADAPLGITVPDSAVVETSLGATLEIPVTFLRAASHKGFKGEWEASLVGLPGQRTWQPVKPPADAAEATLSLALTRKDGNQFVPGTWPLYAAARGTVQWQPEEKSPLREIRDLTISQPIRVAIDSSPVRLSLTTDVVEVACGGHVEMPVNVERRFGFTDVVELKILDVEKVDGLSAAAVTVAKDATGGLMRLEAAADAPPGRRPGVIEALCRWNGEELRARREVFFEVTP